MQKKFLWGLGLSFMIACGENPVESAYEAEDFQEAAQEVEVAAVLTPVQKASLKAKLEGILEIFKGEKVQDAFDKVKANIPTAEQPNYQNLILWNFWKAYNGKNFVGGVEVPETGAQRRERMVNATVAAQSLITEARTNPDLATDPSFKAASFAVDSGINKVLARAINEAAGSTRTVPFLVYSDLSRLSAANKTKFENELARIAPLLEKLPDQHERSLDIILVVDELQDARIASGGYWPPSKAKNWRNKPRTLVPNLDINQFAVDRGRGILALTTNAVLSLNSAGQATSGPEFTLIHESGHSVNQNYGAIQPVNPNGSPRVTVQDYAGLKYPRKKCPAGSPPDCIGPLAPVTEYAAEAYSRYFLKGTNDFCRTDADPPKPPAESMAACRTRIVGHLANSPAFKAPVATPQ